MTNSQPVAEQQSQNTKLNNFAQFPKKVWTPRQEKIRTHENKKEKIPAPQPTPIHKLSMMSMVWNICVGQPGLAAWLCSLPAPAHRLVSWIWETGKKSLISQQQLKTWVLSTFFSYWIQNTATTGRKIILAKTRTRWHLDWLLQNILVFFIFHPCIFTYPSWYLLLVCRKWRNFLRCL